ncbi:N-acetylmuramoyl-L-alanine amidase [Vibrio paucivorans]
MSKVALVIGHRAGSPGAVHVASGVTEFEYNEDVAKRVADLLIERGLEPVIVYRTTYSALPEDINALSPDFILSLHCNSFSVPSATGSETLYYHTSSRSRALAERVQSNIVTALGLADRGIKPKQSEDRGGYLLRYTNAPCVIVEPGFFSNDGDFYVLDNKLDAYCHALADAAMHYAHTS